MEMCMWLPWRWDVSIHYRVLSQWPPVMPVYVKLFSHPQFPSHSKPYLTRNPILYFIVIFVALIAHSISSIDITGDIIMATITVTTNTTFTVITISTKHHYLCSLHHFHHYYYYHHLHHHTTTTPTITTTAITTTPPPPPLLSPPPPPPPHRGNHRKQTQVWAAIEAPSRFLRDVRNLHSHKNHFSYPKSMLNKFTSFLTTLVAVVVR